MSDTTTTAPPPEAPTVDHEPAHEKPGRIKRFWAKTKQVTVRVARRSKEEAKRVGRGIKWLARKTGRASTKLLYGVCLVLGFIGMVLYESGRWLLRMLMLIVSGVVLLAVCIVMFVLSVVALVTVKFLHLISLLLSTPWLALKSREALRADWAIFRDSLKPHFWDMVNPAAIARDGLDKFWDEKFAATVESRFDHPLFGVRHFTEERKTERQQRRMDREARRSATERPGKPHHPTPVDLDRQRSKTRQGPRDPRLAAT